MSHRKMPAVDSYLAQDDGAVPSEEAIDTISKVWQEDLQHEKILFAADNYQIDEEEAEYCSLVLNVQSQRLRIPDRHLLL